MPAPVVLQSIDICIFMQLMNIHVPRSKIYRRNKRSIHEYTSFWKPSAETRGLHMKRHHYIVHEPKPGVDINPLLECGTAGTLVLKPFIIHFFHCGSNSLIHLTFIIIWLRLWDGEKVGAIFLLALHSLTHKIEIFSWGSLSTRVFETRTATGREHFAC